MVDAVNSKDKAPKSNKPEIKLRLECRVVIRSPEWDTTGYQLANSATLSNPRSLPTTLSFGRSALTHLFGQELLKLGELLRAGGSFNRPDGDFLDLHIRLFCLLRESG